MSHTSLFTRFVKSSLCSMFENHIICEFKMKTSLSLIKELRSMSSRQTSKGKIKTFKTLTCFIIYNFNYNYFSLLVMKPEVLGQFQTVILSTLVTLQVKRLKPQKLTLTHSLIFHTTSVRPLQRTRHRTQHVTSSLSSLICTVTHNLWSFTGK